MKQCPKCNKTYDDTWAVCLNDETALVNKNGEDLKFSDAVKDVENTKKELTNTLLFRFCSISIGLSIIGLLGMIIFASLIIGIGGSFGSLIENAVILAPYIILYLYMKKTYHAKFYQSALIFIFYIIFFVLFLLGFISLSKIGEHNRYEKRIKRTERAKEYLNKMQPAEREKFENEIVGLLKIIRKYLNDDEFNEYIAFSQKQQMGQTVTMADYDRVKQLMEKALRQATPAEIATFQSYEKRRAAQYK